MKAENQPVIVTINPGLGIFYGRLAEYDKAAKICTLTEIRMVLQWKGTKGYLGLCKYGPESGSHLSARGPESELQHVESVNLCTPEAWEKANEWPGA